MTTIDHRILIPAPADAVWDFISDITHNPDWQVDCAEVIFLTSRREGPGLRWRYSTPGGHELVVAVTAWYNGLGYEYYFVDGTSFRENKGRIRLQEIPEGTIVQWTFTYELGGVLGGVRNSMGMRRQVDETIAESLKTLWKKIKQPPGGSRGLESKSLMREAPDVEARSAYQPRHPSIMDQAEGEKPLRLASARLKVEPPIADDDAQPIRIFDEPPVREDDTRPRPVNPYAPPAAAAKLTPEPGEVDAFAAEEPDFLEELDAFDRAEAQSPAAEPDFLADAPETDLSRFEPPRDPTDTQPRRTEPDVQAFQPYTPAERTESLVDLSRVGEETEPLPAAREREIFPEPTPEVVEQATTPVPDLGEETQLEIDAEATEKVDDAQTQPAAPASESPLSTEERGLEIFGVPRPSETQEVEELAAETEGETAQPEPLTTEAPEAASVDVEPTTRAEIAAEIEDEDNEAAAEPSAHVDAVPEMQETLPAVEITPAAETKPATRAVAATLELPSAPTRIGLRIVQRRKQVRLRRP